MEQSSLNTDLAPNPALGILGQQTPRPEKDFEQLGCALNATVLSRALVQTLSKGLARA